MTQSTARPAGGGPDSDPADQPVHSALFYAGAAEYVARVGGFLSAGLAAGEPCMVAVPQARSLALRDYLGVQAGKVAFADMTILGRNPARIIPAISAFAGTHPRQLVRYVGEPAWRARSSAEMDEVRRHEALLNSAFAGQPVSILCPYDVRTLDPGVLADAERTHPTLMEQGGYRPSHVFGRHGAVLANGPLPSPPAGLEVLTYREDPGQVRAFARGQARAKGLREPKLTDLVIAVGELAANTLTHTMGPGTICLWATASEVICEVRDSGYIRDALAGRRRPAADAGRGHGLWVVNQVCDLVVMRTGSTGTTFQLHMRIGT